MKKLVSVLLAFSLLFGMSITALADSGEPPVRVVELNAGDRPTPYLTCFKFVYSSISRKDSTITCTASIAARDGYDFDYTIVLKSSTDKVNWDVVDMWTGSDSGNAAIGEYATVDKGYYYQTTVIADGLDSSGSLIETVTAKSSIISY